MLGQMTETREIRDDALEMGLQRLPPALSRQRGSAQQSPMPEDLAWKLLEIGRSIDPPRTAALYAPLQQKEPYPGVKTEREVKYGPAERHLLDVFTPEANSSPRPVLIYIHGGGFVAGNKRAPGSPFYDNIMLWAVKSGFVGVNATYRLAPQCRGRPVSRTSPPSCLGYRQYRRARRRSRPHLPRRAIRRRGACRRLRRIPSFTR